MESFGYFLAKACLFFIALFIGVLLIVYGANVVYDVWGWFAVPLGAPAMVNKWHAAGLSTLMSWPLLSLALGVQDVKDTLAEGKEKPHILQRMYVRLFISALSITFFWGFAALYHHLMTTNPF